MFNDDDVQYRNWYCDREVKESDLQWNTINMERCDLCDWSFTATEIEWDDSTVAELSATAVSAQSGRGSVNAVIIGVTANSVGLAIMFRRANIALLYRCRRKLRRIELASGSNTLNLDIFDWQNLAVGKPETTAGGRLWMST
jgi:hypothetical protein